MLGDIRQTMVAVGGAVDGKTGTAADTPGFGQPVVTAIPPE
jgi:hypothetical protein